MSLAGPGVLALVAVAIVGVMWWLNEWHDQHRATLTPAEREAEDVRDGLRPGGGDR